MQKQNNFVDPGSALKIRFQNVINPCLPSANSNL